MNNKGSPTGIQLEKCKHTFKKSLVTIPKATRCVSCYIKVYCLHLPTSQWILKQWAISSEEQARGYPILPPTSPWGYRTGCMCLVQFQDGISLPIFSQLLPLNNKRWSYGCYCTDVELDCQALNLGLPIRLGLDKPLNLFHLSLPFVKWE